MILGLGLHGGGVGAARFFARLGYKVIVTDLKAKKELSGSLKKLSGLDIRYILGRHRIKDITNGSLIVRNPGIPSDSPYLKAALDHSIPVTSDGELLLELAPREKIIGVTGTKGKTTTSMLIGHLLGKKACVLGIPGVSFFDYFYFRREPDWIVAEFSSFDLEYVERSPHIAVFTSLFPDHLNRYPSFKKYASTKMNLIRYQTKGDIAILSSSSAVRSHLPKTQGKIIRVNQSKRKSLPWPTSPLSGALAAEVGRALGFTQNTIQKRFRSFRPPSGRLEIFLRENSRIFINDTTSTSPGAAIYSLNLIKERFGNHYPLTVITGGEEKSFSIKELKTYARFLKNRGARLVLLAGSMTEKLKKYLPLGLRTHTSMKSAMREAIKSQGIIVLLPAAASFNMFSNEFDRGEKFKKAVYNATRKK